MHASVVGHFCCCNISTVKLFYSTILNIVGIQVDCINSKAKSMGLGAVPKEKSKLYKANLRLINGALHLHRSNDLLRSPGGADKLRMQTLVKNRTNAVFYC